MSDLDKEKVIDMLTDIEQYINENMEDTWYKRNVKTKLSELVFWITYSQEDIGE